jgi:hypothetical protein
MKRRSLEIDRHIIPIASSNLLKYFIFSAAAVGSYLVKPFASEEQRDLCIPFEVIERI